MKKALLLLFSKARVKGHYRADPHTGQQVYGKEHQDTRRSIDDTIFSAAHRPSTKEMDERMQRYGYEVREGRWVKREEALSVEAGKPVPHEARPWIGSKKELVKKDSMYQQMKGDQLSLFKRVGLWLFRKTQLSLFDTKVPIAAHMRQTEAGPVMVAPYIGTRRKKIEESPSTGIPSLYIAEATHDTASRSDQPDRGGDRGGDVRRAADLRDSVRRDSPPEPPPPNAARSYERPADTSGQPYLSDGIKLSRSDYTVRPAAQDVPGALARHLKRHATEAVLLCWQRFQQGAKSFLISDGTGAGKTRQALAVAQLYREAHPTKSVLIVTQNERIIEQAFGSDARVMEIPITPITSASAMTTPGIYVSTYTRLGKGDLDAACPGLVVYDESHNLKNYGSLKTKRGFALLQRARKSLLLTATPGDKAEHFGYLAEAFGWSHTKAMRMLGYEWAEVARGVSAWKRTVPEREALMRVMGLFDDLTKRGLMVKREVSMDNLTVSTAPIALTPDELAREDNKYEALNRTVDGADPKRRGVIKMTGLQKLRNLLEPRKLETAMAAIQDHLRNGRQVVVFANRVETSDLPTWLNAEESDAITTIGTLTELSRRLQDAGLPHAKLYGAHLRKAAQEIESFQSGRAKIAIMTPQAGGTGLSLDDTTGHAPRAMVILTAPFAATDAVQMLGRINRLTTKSRCMATFLSAHGTAIDKWNQDIIHSKLKLLGATVQGDVANLDIEKLSTLSDEALEGVVKGGSVGVWEARHVDLGQVGLPHYGVAPAPTAPADTTASSTRTPLTVPPPSHVAFPKFPIGALGAYARFAPATPTGHWPDATIGFGKHRGATLSRLQQKDPGYLDWMFREMRLPFSVDVGSIDFVRQLAKTLRRKLLLFRKAVQGHFFRNEKVPVEGHLRQDHSGTVTYVKTHTATRKKKSEPIHENAPTPKRVTYPDGRLVPQVGDAVYQRVPGPFGTPASIHGEVYRKGAQLRVRVTKTAALIGGGGGTGKTYALTPHWTVQHDPEITRRTAAREAQRQDEKKHYEEEKHEGERRFRASYDAALEHGDQPFDFTTAYIGQVVRNHGVVRCGETESQRMIVGELETGGPHPFIGLTDPDQPEELAWPDHDDLTVPSGQDPERQRTEFEAQRQARKEAYDREEQARQAAWERELAEDDKRMQKASLPSRLLAFVKKAMPLTKARIRSYTRSDGTTVREHDDQRKSATPAQPHSRATAQQKVWAWHKPPNDVQEPRPRTVSAQKTAIHVVEPAEPGKMDEWLANIYAAHDLASAREEVSNGVATDRQHKDAATGEWTIARRRKHERIVHKILNPKAATKEGEQPQCVFLMGAPASGKTSALQPAAKDLGVAFTVINADDVKEQLPEYNGRNAGLVHEESSYIAEKLIAPEVLRRRHHTIWDVTGANTEKITQMVDIHHRHGYQITILYAHLPIEKAAARAVARFRDKGRFVPPEYVVNVVDGKPEQTYNALKGDSRVARFRRYDTDVPKNQQATLQEKGTRAEGAGSASAPVRKSQAGPGVQALREHGRRLHGSGHCWPPYRAGSAQALKAACARAASVRTALVKSLHTLDFDLDTPNLEPTVSGILRAERLTTLEKIAALDGRLKQLAAPNKGPS